MTAPSPEVFELRHQVLAATDRAVGAEAELARLQGEIARYRAEAARASAAEQKLRAERDALRKKVAALRASTTWKVGRLVVAPAARIARAARRAR